MRTITTIGSIGLYGNAMSSCVSRHDTPISGERDHYQEQRLLAPNNARCWHSLVLEKNMSIIWIVFFNNGDWQKTYSSFGRFELGTQPHPPRLDRWSLRFLGIIAVSCPVKQYPISVEENWCTMFGALTGPPGTITAGLVLQFAQVARRRQTVQRKMTGERRRSMSRVPHAMIPKGKPISYPGNCMESRVEITRNQLLAAKFMTKPVSSSIHTGACTAWSQCVQASMYWQDRIPVPQFPQWWLNQWCSQWPTCWYWPTILVANAGSKLDQCCFPYIGTQKEPSTNKTIAIVGFHY